MAAMSIADLRREYNLTGLRRGDVDADPVGQFNKWFGQVAGHRASGRLRKFLIGLYKALHELRGAQAVDVNAMVLATADKQGRPSARTVLLKGVDERGFIFFTNYESRKGQELADNPHAALVFYWPEQERQVCVTGQVSKLSPQESDAYFQSRPRGSRLGAWASRQSQPVPDRTALEESWRQIEVRYAGSDIPRPAHWGGYVLVPSAVEFWQGRPNRLHDRIRYTRESDNRWRIERLFP